MVPLTVDCKIAFCYRKSVLQSFHLMPKTLLAPVIKYHLQMIQNVTHQFVLGEQ